MHDAASFRTQDGFSVERVALHDWGQMLDGARDADSMPPLGVHRKGEGAVGEGIGDGAVGDSKPVDHVFSHLEAASAHAWRTLQNLNAQPLTHGVCGHHAFDDGVHVGITHEGKIGVRCT